MDTLIFSKIIFLLPVFIIMFAKCVHNALITELPLTTSFLRVLNDQKFSPKVSSVFKKEYDYIVVGAGSAGSVVASRLSEISCISVLLLEAGEEPPILSEIPALSMGLWFTKFDWQFKTVPQKNTGIGLKNRQLPLPAGKMLGGTSSINEMLYVRGNKKNFDDWAAQGAEGWSYKDVLPYFLKLENNMNAAFVANGYHNTSGPISAEQTRYPTSIKRYLRNAVRELGFDFVDSNAQRQTGIYPLQTTTKNGRRCSTAKGYLVPAENRKNLDIVTNAMVKKVIFDNHRAIGVVFDFHAKTFYVHAKQEIILSAGTINTPQILMLSGVGPKEELQKFNIPVIMDLPVGRNLHDHAAAIMPYALGLTVQPVWLKCLNPANIVKYITTGSGIYSSAAFLHFLAFLNGNSSSVPPDFPNYEIYLGELTTAIFAAKFYGLKKEVYEALFQPYDLRAMFLCLVTQTQPRSRGYLTLNSTNIYDQPLIDPNYLDHPQDLNDLIDGMKVCQKIGTSRAMRPVNSNPLSTLIPGCERYAKNENNYFRCQLRHIAISAHHLVGTAKMGSVNDPTTVVDSHLRVKNIDGLRVVDASVMPTVTSGNTNIPVIMIAEKISDVIKKGITCQENGDKVKETNTKKLSESEFPDFPSIELPDSEAEDILQDSLDILQSLMDDLLTTPILKNNTTFIMNYLENPLKYLNAKGQEALKNIIGDAVFSALGTAISDADDKLTDI